MPRTVILMDDFSTGEVSRLTEAKVASQEFKDGVREATNIVPDPHGPLIGRPGFEFVLQLTGITEGYGVTMFPVRYSPDAYFFVIMWDLNILVIDKYGATILAAATPHTELQMHGENSDEHLVTSFLSPDGLDLIILCADQPPYLVAFTKGDPWTATYSAASYTSMPAEWTGSNYPTTGTYYQSRAWYSGCQDDPEKFWGSVVYDPYNFSPGAEEADDAIEASISKHGRIRWIEGGRNLLVGTETAEHIITSDTGVITPGDIQVEIQSNYGSNEVQPKSIGSEVLYVSSDSRKLRSMWWKYLESGWYSIDATFTAEHMTREGISDISFCRNPYSDVWLLLKNGDLIVCSYRRKTEDDNAIVGWFRISSDAMFFLTTASGNDRGVSDLWAVVRSKAEGEVNYHVVKYNAHDYLDDDRIYLDGFRIYEDVNDTQVDVTGDFFDVTLSVIADGFHIPDVVPDEGIITLPIEAQTVIVGYPYSQRIVTMPLISKSSEYRDTNLSHHKKRWNKVFLRLISAYYPMVNGHRPPERYASTNDDTPEAYRDSFVQITPGFGWDRDGILEIEQDLPFRLILTGIYGEVASDTI